MTDSDIMWIAVCLPCWRRWFSISADPPQVGGWPEEVCVFCRKRTNHGVYVDASEARGRRPRA